MLGAEEPDRLSKEIHQFIYKNEHLCGDQFRDSNWLPAHENCQMECDMLTEMCQESKKSAFIKAQRCIQCEFFDLNSNSMFFSAETLLRRST